MRRCSESKTFHSGNSAQPIQRLQPAARVSSCETYKEGSAPRLKRGVRPTGSGSAHNTSGEATCGSCDSQ